MGLVLEVENLSVERGGEEVLRDLSFGLEEGDFLTVLGPNGAGKSTLLKALVGSLPGEGRVRWREGVEFNYLPEGLSRQDFEAYPLTVSDFFRLSGEPEKVGEMLARVGLAPEFKERDPASLSSGEFRRVLVAWSLIGEPDVLLFDEPMGGIDVGGKNTIYSLLRDLWRERGLTVVLVTHEINVVYDYSTHVLCLSRRKLCHGEPKEVLTPKNLEEIYGHKVKFYEHR